jgi:oligoendopeptidase F
MAKRLLRAEVPEELTWNLADLFESREAWEAALNEIRAALPGLKALAEQAASGSAALLQCLTELESVWTCYQRVQTYASLRFAEDGSNPDNQADAARVMALGAEFGQAVAAVEAAVLSVSEEELRRMLDEEPGLAPFRKFLTDLAETRTHRLHPETEQALQALGEVLGAPYQIYQRSKSADMEFAPIRDAGGTEHPVSFALYEDRYEFLADTDLRRKAYDSFVATLRRYRNTFAAAYAAEVNKHVALARLRRYGSTEEMLLQPQQVPLEMYHNLLSIIRTELARHMRRLAKLRQRVLGLDKMRFCDLKVPLDSEFVPRTTVEEAGRLIQEALSVFGPDYTAIVATALKDRWVDLADNVGKSTGAFCSSPYGVHPYILITWTDTMRGAFVLAHELGHAAHFTLAQRHQRFINTRPSMSFIEAPSTMHEMMLGRHILAKSDDARMRRWVLLQWLGTYHHNFVTHLLEAELQHRVYQAAESGKAITANLLCELKGEILSEFWGDTVEIDEGATLTWMRQPHYYMGLYPYTYSAGLTVSTLVSRRISEEGEAAAQRWLEVLKAGGTLRPLELMQFAGVDMSRPEPIREAVAFVGSLVDELERSYGGQA